MNVWSPIVFLVLIVLLANRIQLLLRRKLYLDVCQISIKSERYLGANPMIILKVISTILNSMRACTGNQCNSLIKYWSDMAKLRRTVNEPSTSVQYTLEFLYLTFWNSVQEAITIVQSACDKGMNQLFSMLF